MDVVEESVPNFKTIVASEIKENMGIYNAVTTSTLTAVKYVGKSVGVVGALNTVCSIRKDCEEYNGNNLGYSIMADVGSTLAGIAVAGICSVSPVGVVGGILSGTVVALFGSYMSNT